MRYLFLLRPEDGQLHALTDEERAALLGDFITWTQSLKTRGHLVAVERLKPTGGTTVRKKRDAIVVDGPYAEMRELVSGLFIVDAAGLDQAHALARECPLLTVDGSIEVREIDDFPIKP